MKKLLLVFFTTVSIASLTAQVAVMKTGRSFGNASLSGATKTWTNTANVAAADNQYASFGNLPNTAGSHTDYLLAADFGFNIPQGFWILGIKVYVDNSDLNNTTSDYSIRILKNGMISKGDRSAGALYSSPDSSSQIYGGLNDLWGETWTPADINAKEFGVAIAAQRGVTGKPTEGHVDNIRVVVNYIDPDDRPSATLPLSLVQFSATLKTDMVRIEWKTTDESEMSRFEVQKSPDGNDFKSFGTMMCLYQSTPALYAFNDYAPFRGTSYYRLKVLQKTGSVAYSKVVVIQFKTNNAATLYPSPAKKGQPLFIRNPGNERLTIEFYDNAGTSIARVTTSSAQVPVDGLNNSKGLLRYKVFDEKNKQVGTGSLAIY